MFFWKIFQARIFALFHDRIKHKAGGRLHPLAENNKPIVSFQTKQTNQTFGGLHTLVITEYNSGSLLPDTDLYYTLYTRT